MYSNSPVSSSRVGSAGTAGLMTIFERPKLSNAKNPDLYLTQSSKEFNLQNKKVGGTFHHIAHQRQFLKNEIKKLKPVR